MPKKSLDVPTLKCGVLLQVAPECVRIQDDPMGPFYDDDLDRRGIDEKLVLNIMAFGVQEPVKCAKHADLLFAVDGRRRIENAIEANKRLKSRGDEPKKIPVIIRPVTAEMGQLIAVSLNTHRLNHSPLVKLNKMAAMLSTGYTEEQIAVAFGVTEAQVKNYVRVIDNCSAVKKAVENGTISITAASKIEGTKDEQEAQLAELTKNGAKPTAERAARIAKGNTGDRPTRKQISAIATSSAAPVQFNAFAKWLLGECPIEEVAAVEDMEWIAKVLK